MMQESPLSAADSLSRDERKLSRPFVQPLADLVRHLENRITLLQEREAFHAAQAAHHQAERDRHGTELQEVTEHCRSLKAAANAACKLVERSAVPLVWSTESFGTPSRPKIAMMVARIVERKGAIEPFTASSVTADVDQIFGPHLKRPVGIPVVSNALRRCAATGHIHILRRGGARQETVYVRAAPG